MPGWCAEAEASAYVNAICFETADALGVTAVCKEVGWMKKSLRTKPDLSRSDTRESIRYLIGRVCLSFGTLLFGGFFIAGLYLRQEGDTALPIMLFHMGIGIAFAFCGGAFIVLYHPEKTHADREPREEERFLARRGETAMAALSIIAFVAAVLIFLLTDKYAAALFDLCYGIYLSLRALEFRRNKSLAGRMRQHKHRERKRKEKPWNAITG